LSVTRIAKNVGSGLLAQVWSVLLGLVALPILVRGLGPDRYGLLALCLAIIGFASIADLGVGRAASKYLAEDFEKREHSRIQKHVSTALTVCTLMGLAGTLILVSMSSIFVQRIFRVPPAMEAEAKAAICIMALGLLPVLLRILFDGVLAGHHRIALLSAGNTISNTLKAALSIAAIVGGYSLLAVVLANVVVSYLHAIGLWLYVRRYWNDEFKIRLGWDTQIARQLLSLGIGSSISFIIGWVMFLYLDRFLIASFLAVSLVGYYSAAFDVASKQWYVAFSVAQAFFPEFSGKAVSSTRDLQRRYLQANKVVAVGASGLAMLLLVFGREFLTYWISPDFGVRAGSVMVLLSLALMLSSYVVIPYNTIIAAAARPDVCTRFFVVAMAIHLVVSILLMKLLGMIGVALAFVFAYVYVLGMVFRWVRDNLVPSPLGQIVQECFSGAWVAAVIVGFGLWFLVKPRVHSLAGVFLACGAGYATYLGLCALTAYTSEERSSVLQLGRSMLRGAS
jgi:O-antigen/teichoic acid export membrane protein